MKRLCSIVSLSGGVDSATALAIALERRDTVHAVSFVYGSKHNWYERTAAGALVGYYNSLGVNIAHHVVDAGTVFAGFRSNLLKTGGDIPEGHYQDESMKLTVVPARNLIFLSILAGLAESLECEAIILGVHTGDHAIYPDCRPEFIQAARTAVSLATDGKVALETPLMSMDKAHIVRVGLQLKVPYQFTRTCYKDQMVACGKCGSCQERLEAFRLNNYEDPILYETP